MAESIQIETIQIKRGPKANLPKLEEGEMAFCTDSKEIFIGDGNENIPINQSSYIHNQISASDEWIIEHNLNKYPAVTVVDSALSVVIGNIKYISQNKLQLNFNAAFSGKAYLN